MAYTTLRHEDETVSRRTGSRPASDGTVHVGADSSDFFEEGAARLIRSGSALRYRSGTSKLFPSRNTAHDCTSSFADTAVRADRCAFPFAVSRSYSSRHAGFTRLADSAAR